MARSSGANKSCDGGAIELKSTIGSHYKVQNRGGSNSRKSVWWTDQASLKNGRHHPRQKYKKLDETESFLANSPRTTEEVQVEINVTDGEFKDKWKNKFFFFFTSMLYRTNRKKSNFAC